MQSKSSKCFKKKFIFFSQKIKPRKIEYISPRQSLVPTEDDRISLPRSYCSSPTPYSQPSVGNLLHKFSPDSGSERNVVYKKRTAPKPPARNDSTPPWMKKGPAPPRPGSPARPEKSDPIRELESMGRKLSDEVSLKL
jgi:hypothetical protein